MCEANLQLVEASLQLVEARLHLTHNYRGITEGCWTLCGDTSHTTYVHLSTCLVFPCSPSGLVSVSTMFGYTRHQLHVCVHMSTCPVTIACLDTCVVKIQISDGGCGPRNLIMKGEQTIDFSYKCNNFPNYPHSIELYMFHSEILSP